MDLMDGRRDAEWPEEWRGLLIALRRHEDGDVRYAARKTALRHE
ncbi:hypothetical protein [Streptomyces sp. NPDC127084]